MALGRGRISPPPHFRVSALLVKNRDLQNVDVSLSSAMTSLTSISPKLAKTIDKLKTRIKNSPDYDVHQELKAVASRFVSYTV
jgi:hypothetical protein